MNLSCAALSTTLPGTTLPRSSTSLSSPFLVVVAVAVTARLEVARGAAAEEDDDDDDDNEEEEEERDKEIGAVCCDEQTALVCTAVAADTFNAAARRHATVVRVPRERLGRSQEEAVQGRVAAT